MPVVRIGEIMGGGMVIHCKFFGPLPLLHLDSYTKW